MSAILDEIRNRLTVLAPQSVAIDDDSAKHAGHAGAAQGGGHFRLSVVAECFRGKSRVARHREVYALLADLIPTRVHALSIDARTPDEPGIV